jgi:UDP-2,4-diacetamido-2,4,6-trideoxy-beta-L-altropyranose hydrolase
VRVISIDDLANREHDCHLLVDQNLGRSEDDYRRFVPAKCQILTGPRFALLRSEFAEWRTFSLQRRASARLRRLFISMGGFDHSDVTSQVLAALQNAPLSPDSQITVALGRGSSWSDHVRSEVDRLPWATEVVVGAPRIAEIMANSDLAIGAAGGTAWERCCLGLPTLIVAVAENQRLGANALVGANAAYGLGGSLELADSIPQALRSMSHPERLHEMSLAASRLVDGLGAGRVGRHLGHLIGCAYAN